MIQQGRTARVAGDEAGPLPLLRPGRGHDCALAGCQRHACKPLKPQTIRILHSILSGAFAAARRWGYVDFNPAESARPPKTSGRKKIAATPPSVVVRVPDKCDELSRRNLRLYIWLTAITGVRRGKLCGLQLRDIDLELG